MAGVDGGRGMGGGATARTKIVSAEAENSVICLRRCPFSASLSRKARSPSQQQIGDSKKSKSELWRFTMMKVRMGVMTPFLVAAAGFVLSPVLSMQAQQ
ncbi:MAG TPA: hypothetical protein VFI20_07240, partial [Terracidiphilus sp.]|nr:hypothetical protein [Terracidiphilus sp.]